MKPFDSWNNIKKSIETSNRKIMFKPGDVWWCSLGINIGSEEDGKNTNFERPILVITKFNERSCLCVPLTSKLKEDRFHVMVKLPTQHSSAIVSQIKIVSTKRFLREMGAVSPSDLRKVKEKLHAIIR